MLAADERTRHQRIAQHSSVRSQQKQALGFRAGGVVRRRVRDRPIGGARGHPSADRRGTGGRRQRQPAAASGSQRQPAAAVQTGLQTTIRENTTTLADLYSVTHAEAALIRERELALKKQIEACCPPRVPEPACHPSKCPEPGRFREPDIRKEPAPIG